MSFFRYYLDIFTEYFKWESRDSDHVNSQESSFDTSTCDELIDDFARLSLREDEKKLVKNATIYQIYYPYPGIGFRRWKKTNEATFYKNENNEIKVYHYPSNCFPKSKNSETIS